jgi:hypothetical protein
MERVTESFPFSGGTVDRSGKYPVIRGVLLCGRESAWKRRYLSEAFAGDRLKVYDDRPVYLNHSESKGSRKYEDQVGWVEPGTVRHNADGLPVGDIGIKPTHLQAESVLWDVENRPQNCSMSHVADINTREGAGGWREVVECKYVDSVDIVTSGATTSTMFREGGRPVVMKVKEYANKLAPKCSVEQLLKLRELAREDDMGGAAMAADAPAPDADGTDAGAGVDAAFEAAILAEIKSCMGAAGDAAKVKGCLKKIKKLLMSHGDIKSDGGDGEGDGDGADEEPGKKAEEGKAGGKKKPTGQPAEPDPWALMDECAKESFTPSAVQLKALKGMPDAADRNQFIREQKGLAAATNPTSKSREQLAKEKAKEGGGDTTPATGVEAARLEMAKLSAEARGGK